MAAGYGVACDDATADEIVSSWRKARPKTVELWSALDNLLLSAIFGVYSRQHRLCIGGARLIALREKIAGRDTVQIVLPSGRALTYWAPRVEQVGDRREIAVETYRSGGCGPDSRLHAEAEGARYSRVWGGRICEYIVQAVAFDLLLSSLFRMRDAGLRIAFHVHDEIIVVSKNKDADDVARIMAKCMTEPPEWARGLPRATEPEIMSRYRK